MTRKENTNYIITGALIAAAYAGLTYLSNAFSLGYGPIQLRLSEALSVLPVFTPAAISGLTIGCFISNIGSFNVADLLFGTAATLVSSILTRALKDNLIKGVPVFSLLPPVIINALVIGFEIAVFYLNAQNFLLGFLISAIQVGLGQMIVCFAFGIPVFMVVKKYRIFK